jgi:hypothetical protein
MELVRSSNSTYMSGFVLVGSSSDSEVQGASSLPLPAKLGCCTSIWGPNSS